ncbi:FAD-dependent oxidoreductase [Paracoccus aestuariivivens]|uniref:FAD-dependent oxidoreductase n=2 Tax=Paracoccus aestuariivivens TaxID=1820333 RepID=A0A6L6J8X2_9RHOB|nr:FAD-binding oxidoreductase [Paracoccus aestuariivivens]MTH78450.1 FAD-dependent oxidoreductase [Paracoccus aestuariivivens]
MPFSGELQTDVAIVGGGYTGLSTARALAAQGVDVVVLEANRLGWGASGRNGGVVSGKFRLGFAEMARRWDIATARRMHDIGIEAIENVGAVLEEFGIDADYRPSGSLRCAHRPEALEALRAECDWLRGTLGDDAVSILDAEEMAAETGSRDFCGGMLNRHGGVIHPLKFHRGLAAGLRGRGLRIHDESPVTGIAPRADGGVDLHLASGRVRARQVVLATNAYSGLTPAASVIERRVVPFRSAMVATQPLTGTAAEALLAHGRSYTETRRMMRWFRKSGDRLLYGGRGAFGKSDSPAAFAALEKAMLTQFPQLAGLQVTHRWSGLVAMTMDSLPHLGRIDGRIVYAMGYNGTGVALASYIGPHVADLVLGRKPDAGLLGQLPLPQVPLYPVREVGVRIVAGWYQFLDAVGK